MFSNRTGMQGRIAPENLADNSSGRQTTLAAHGSPTSLESNRNASLDSKLPLQRLTAFKGLEVTPGARAIWKHLEGRFLPNPRDHYGLINLRLNEPPEIPFTKKTAISVGFNGRWKILHANRITLSRNLSSRSAETNEKKYVAAKTPRYTEEYQRMLLDCIESKQGLFQFVSLSTHALPPVRKGAYFMPTEDDESFVRWLMHMSEKDFFGPHAGESYNFRSLNEVTIPVEQSADAGCRQYVLTVKKMFDGGLKGPVVSIPVTQVGMEFSDQILTVKHLEAAKSFLNYHLAFARSDPDTIEPRIFCSTGMGRSAAMIVYQEMSERIRDGLIQNEKSLDTHLAAIIDKGREDRGPGFLHSVEQLNEIRIGLRSRLQKYSAGRGNESPISGPPVKLWVDMFSPKVSMEQDDQTLGTANTRPAIDLRIKNRK